jgi:hypothetical protein
MAQQAMAQQAMAQQARTGRAGSGGASARGAAPEVAVPLVGALLALAVATGHGVRDAGGKAQGYRFVGPTRGVRVHAERRQG